MKRRERLTLCDSDNMERDSKKVYGLSNLVESFLNRNERRSIGERAFHRDTIIEVLMMCVDEQ